MGALRRGPWGKLAPHAALLAGYVALAAYAERFAVTPDGNLSVWYPPPGLVLVVLQRWGLRFWPAAFLAELVVSIVVYDVADDFGVALTLVNAAGISGAYALGACIIRATAGGGILDVRTDLAWFVLATFLVAAPLAAVTGVAVQDLAGFELDGGFARSVATWWVGDAIGLLVLAPVGYAIVRRSGDLAVWSRDGLGRLGLFEVCLIASVPAMPVAVFAVTDPPQPLYLILLPVVLVAVRHGAGPGAWAVLLSVLVTTVAAYESGGDTIGRTDLQVLLLTVAMAGNAIGLLERLRRRASGHADDLDALMDLSPDLVAVVGEDGGVRWANPAAHRLLGLAPDEAADRAPDPAGGGASPRLDPLLDGGAVAAALEQGSWHGTVHLARPDGDLHLSELAVRLPDQAGRRVGLVARDITDLQILADQLHRLAFTDELTGLANRARLFDRLSFAVGRAEAGTLHGLVLIDLDRFAVINDHHGHEAGDAVLRGAAERLGQAVRTGELLARIGDNRFAVLLEDISHEFAAVAAAERLRNLAGGDWVASLGHDLDGIELSASAGVVIAQPGDEPDLVARRADLAIGQAKEAGGDRTFTYDAVLSDRLGERIRIEAVLREALGSGGWPLRYQPVVRLDTVEVVGCEALLVPKAPPLEVVAVAEELGLIGRLGEQVLHHALAQAVRWRVDLPALVMGVNVSAHQLLDPDFPELVEEALVGCDLPAEALVLEVTETAFAEDLPHASEAAAALRGLGVQLSIDDFGTGFSSLGRLRSLPVDELKLDRTFVADLGRVEGAESIVAAVVALGAARGLGVVAEGVEEEAQRRSLLDLGCTMGQGWLFAHPMEPPDFEAWVAEHG